MEDVEEGIGFGLIRTSSYDGLSWGLEEDETEVSGGCGGGGGVIRGGGKGDGSDGDDLEHKYKRKRMQGIHLIKFIFWENYFLKLIFFL